jgi:hypothetical protein
MGSADSALNGDRMPGHADIPYLNHHEQGMLSALAEMAGTRSHQDVRESLAQHAAWLQVQAETNTMINMSLARALAATLDQALLKTRNSPDHGRWIKAAACYFIHVDDDENDLASPIGFDDDAEVVNACLRHVGLGNLCVKIEDHDVR